MTSPPESASIYDWAVPGNLQPEPITVEVWRNLPEEFCREVELVNGQAIRCERPSRAHQAAASRIMAMLDAAASAHMERNPGTCLDTCSQRCTPAVGLTRQGCCGGGVAWQPQGGQARQDGRVR